MKFAFAVLALAILSLAPTMRADVQVLTPGSAGVGSAINDVGGFFVFSDTFSAFGSLSYATDPVLHAGGAAYWLGTNGPAYSDAGFVIGLDGKLTLGQLQSVSVISTGSPLAINLWLDTGGDGKFFAIDSSGLFTGLNGDSYAGCGGTALTASSSCYMLGGDGAGSTLSLANLQVGGIPGINGNTPTALWVGVTHSSGAPIQDASVGEITITTGELNAVPEPGSLALLGAYSVGILALARLRGRKV